MTIETLPPEIILQILQQASELDTSSSNSPHTFPSAACTPQSAIFTHLRVCQRWRTIILDSPGLFSQILISIFISSSRQTVAIKRYTDFWLEKSKECPLDNTIQLSGYEIDVKAFQDILHNSIRPSLWRLRAFRVVFWEKEEPHSLVSLFYPLLTKQLDAPLLEELSIQYHDGMGRHLISLTPVPSHPNSLFSSPPPKLRTVMAWGIDLPAPFTKTLTHLDLFHVNLESSGFRKLVDECPDLEVIALRAIRIPITPSMADDESTEPIYMPRLKTLTLEFGQKMQHTLTDNAKRVLAYVVAPNLQVLEVSTGGIPIWLGNILPDPTQLGRLKRLRMDGVVRDAENLSTGRVVDNSRWFRELPGGIPLEEVEMVHSVGEVLGIKLTRSDVQPQPMSNGDDLDLFAPAQVPVPPLPPCSRDLLGQRSYESFVLSSLSPSSSVTPSTPFANLRAIAIDTTRADEMLWFCRLLAARPSIRVATLSESALGSLRSSLFLWKDAGEDGDVRIRLRRSSFIAYLSGFEEGDPEGMNVVEWVKGMVGELWVARRGVRVRV
ncbi:hypothetical protein PQX77_009518 [Marasmius sp. AFHP31]|nr:hypothetical protein PQX77_009518 [Marasmius sp. AFHP31]